MFGLFGGSGKKDKALDDIQKLIDEHKDDTADKDLDVMLQASHDLKATFNAEVSRSSPSAKLLLRIEQLSDGILGNLEARITEDLLADDKGVAIAARCGTIAKELDDVRATKASTLITTRTVKMQERMGGEAMKQLQEAFAKVGTDKATVPHANIMVHAKDVLDAIEAVHVKAPTSVPVTTKLVEVCVKLANCLIQLLMQALIADAANGIKAKQHSDRLDGVAEKLVAVIGSSWDPPASPQVDAKIDEAINKIMSSHNASLEAEIAKAEIDRDIIIKVYTATQPWWPLVKDVTELTAAFQAVSERVDAAMIDVFGKVIEAGDKPTADILLKFAEDMDVLTATFHGIKVSETSLRAAMMDKLADVGEKLDALEADLKKKPDEPLAVASMNMALTTLEGLAPLWKMTVASDASMGDKLSGILDVLETRVTESISSCPLAQALQFFKAAPKYDGYRAEMELEEHGFEKALGPLVANSLLHDAEEEIAKYADISDVDITALINALEEFKSPVLKSCIGDDGDLKSRAKSALRASEEVMVKEFESSAGEKKRRQELVQFAGRFDVLCPEIEPDVPEDERTSLANTLQLMPLVAQVGKLVAEGREGELDCTMLQKLLDYIPKLTQPPISDSGDVVGQMQSLKPKLKDALFARTMKADEPTMAAVFECAKKLEIALASLEKREPTEEGSELCEELKKIREVNKSFQEIQIEFDKETGRDPNVVLQALQGLKSKWASVEDLADFNLRLIKVYNDLQKRLCAACQLAFVDGDLAKVERLIRYSKRCDDVGSNDDASAQMSEALHQTVVKYNLSAIKQELDKDAGFHPKRILDALRALNPHFQCLGLGNLEDAQKTLAKLRGTIGKRMATAWDASEEMRDKRKLAGLREFASQYDSAFADINEISGFVEVIELHTDEPAVDEEEDDDVWVAPTIKTAVTKDFPEEAPIETPTSGEQAMTQLSDAELAQLIAMLPSPLKDPYVKEANRRKGG